MNSKDRRALLSRLDMEDYVEYLDVNALYISRR